MSIELIAPFTLAVNPAVIDRCYKRKGGQKKEKPLESILDSPPGTFVCPKIRIAPAWTLQAVRQVGPPNNQPLFGAVLECGAALRKQAHPIECLLETGAGIGDLCRSANGGGQVTHAGDTLPGRVGQRKLAL